MQRGLVGTFLLAGLALVAAPSGAKGGLGIGDKAPLPAAKEFIGLPSYSPRDLDGKVVFIEVFRTW